MTAPILPQATLSHQGLHIPLRHLKSFLKSEYFNFLKKLTLVFRPKIGPPINAEMYEVITKDSVEYLRVPRSLIVKFPTTVLYPEYTPMNFPTGIFDSLYANQMLIINYLVNTIYTPERRDKGQASCYLDLRAGMGKTFVAAGLIAKLNVRTLYLVAKAPLAEQAVKDLRGSLFVDLPNDPKLLSQIGGGVRKKYQSADAQIVVCIINSAMNKPDAFFEQFGLVIMDEVHQFCSPSRRKIFGKAAAPYCLAMSATTDHRSDGFDSIVHKEIAVAPVGDFYRDQVIMHGYNKKIVRVPDPVLRAENIPGFGYDEVIFKSTVHAIKYCGPPSHTEAKVHPTTGRLFTPYMNEQYVSDIYRCKLVLRELRRLYDWRDSTDPTKQHCIYVFCETVAPLAQLRKVFLEANLPVSVPELDGPEDSIQIHEFTGGCKDVTNITTNARIILTTYAYSSTGISVNRMTAMIFMTPRRSNMIQILARCLRRDGDRSITREYIDIIDHNTPLKYQHTTRKIAYEFYEMDIVYSKVTWEEFI